MRKSRRVFFLLILALTVSIASSCSLDPNVRKSKYLASGKSYLEKAKYQEAAIQFQNAIGVDKQYPEAHYELAKAYLKFQIWNGAYQELMKTVDLQPKNWQAQIDLGGLLLASREYGQAREKAQLVPIAANNLAYLMLEHGGNEDVALSLAQVARRGAPENPYVAGTLAWAYYQKSAYRISIDLLEEAVSKDPSNATMQYHLGLAYQKVNDRARAKQHLERALQIDPKFTQADETRKALAELTKS